ncbi:MAG: right-handed parallel beta-helix repeat-containing protein, partial [Bacteroidales bacterium]|nr:right-handed parallel beta-helix repeat-containing protein [Bacteroidales bacterium]
MKRIIIIALSAVFSLNLWAQTVLSVKDNEMDVHHALRTVREWRRLDAVGKSTGVDLSKGVVIELPEGQFFLDEPLFLRPEDAGTAESPTIIRGAANGKTILSGGCALPAKAWKKVSKVPGLPAKAQSKVYVCPQPKVAGRYLSFRQLWVNGQKAVRARDVNDFDQMKRMLAWDKHQQVLTIPTPEVKHFQTLDGMELVLHQMWAISNLRVASLTRNGDSTQVRFHQPESRVQAEHPWPCPMTTKGLESPYYLCNAIEFLDMPGEWYLDEDKHLLYYWPRQGEVLSKAEVIVPSLETLVDVQGTKERPVSHVRFENITFSHTSWMRPSLQGHVPLQA